MAVIRLNRLKYLLEFQNLANKILISAKTILLKSNKPRLAEAICGKRIGIKFSANSFRKF